MESIHPHAGALWQYRANYKNRRLASPQGLSVPTPDKASEILEYGHGGPPRAETLRFTLGWFDKYLGEVRR